MSLAADGEDGNGLQLEKLRLVVSARPVFTIIDINNRGLFSPISSFGCSKKKYSDWA